MKFDIEVGKNPKYKRFELFGWQQERSIIYEKYCSNIPIINSVSL